MSVITVSNQSGLLDAFATAKGGDTVVLKDGNYGSVKVTADYSSNVTVRAENPLHANINELKLWGASNLTFDGVRFYSGSDGAHGRGIVSIENGSQNIGIINTELSGSVNGSYYGHYGVLISNSNNIRVKNNNIHDVDSGVVAFGSVGSDISGNQVDYFGRDAFKFAGLSSSEVQDNISYGHVYAIGAAHTDFMQFQGDSSHVLIEGNAYLPATGAAVKGIFMADGSYHDITIENNLIYTGMQHGITIYDGSGIVVRDNTLLNAPGLVHNLTIISAPGGSVVEDNIVASTTGGTFGSNLQLQNKKPGQAYYVDDYFKNGSAGLGVTARDLTPVPGSAAESKGAIALLKDLLGGTWSPPHVSSPVPTPGPTPAPAPGTPSGGDGLIAVNAGGPATGGFDADAFYSGGRAASTATPNPDGAVYQTERYGTFSYSAPVDNGTYDVTLKMAEFYFGAAGKRVFDVKAEGKLALDNYDVFAEAGGKDIAHDETFRVAVKDGHLNLDFVSVVNNAKVSAIEIDPAAGGSSSTQKPAPSGGHGLIAVNAGGPAAGGFDADTFYSGGKAAGTGTPNPGGAVYQTERYGTFGYSAPVDDGTYEVTLKMAEFYFDAAGKRVFDVRAEGKLELHNYDVFAEAGGKNIAHDETFQVDVKDGHLDLDFVSLVNNAKISAIEIHMI